MLKGKNILFELAKVRINGRSNYRTFTVYKKTKKLCFGRVQLKFRTANV